MQDGAELPESLVGISMAMGTGDEARASELLAMGAERVLLGDLAILDSTAVERLVQQHGAERIGIWVRAAKTHVSWAIDYISNEDFNCLTPSVGSPGWDVLKNDGFSTKSDVEWWVKQMLGFGASMALINVDMQDNDLNLCAGLIESHGDKLWFTPRHEPNADLEPWVRWGQVRQLVLPTPNERDEAEMARICAPAMIMVEDDEETVAVEEGAVEEIIVEKNAGEEHAVQA
jgi:hypothetical protein